VCDVGGEKEAVRTGTQPQQMVAALLHHDHKLAPVGLLRSCMIQLRALGPAGVSQEASHEEEVQSKRQSLVEEVGVRQPILDVLPQYDCDCSLPLPRFRDGEVDLDRWELKFHNESHWLERLAEAHTDCHPRKEEALLDGLDDQIFYHSPLTQTKGLQKPEQERIEHPDELDIVAAVLQHYH
jgi:hypothetical protein